MEGQGTHSYIPDPRNADILIDVGGTHFPRDEAKVSVFDSGFMLGDGVWGAHWSDKVNASTGFGEPLGELPALEGEYAEVAEVCRDDYEALALHAL